MRFALGTLIKPIDPVVSVHPCGRDADAAVAALRRAGYGDRMVSVVGQTDSSPDPGSLMRRVPGTAPHWAASGMGLGLLWALFTAAVAVLHPAGGTAFVALVTLAALALVLQAAVVAQIVAPGRCLPSDRSTGSALPSAVAGQRPWRFLVVVHGSRSEVALARDIVAAH